MRTATIAAVVDQLRHHLAGRRSDAELLDAFIARRDQAAFAELVRRHGPKVFAVCRRVLGGHHLAEDAYQATFVVLARKAHRVHPRSAIGGFLYGVARKAALEAYALSRRRKETLVASVPDVSASDPPRAETDALAALDEEIANLSDALRAAVVLCELDGVGRAEAARQLGIPEGTLSSRLAAARRQLAARLKARGVTGSAALFAALAASADAAPPALKVASPTVCEIARGVLRTMLLAKLKTAAPVCAAVVALALWALAPAQLTADPVGRLPVPAVPVAAPLPVEKPEPRESTFVVGCVNNSKPGELAALYAADGAARGFVAVGELKIILSPRVSPDGKRLAFVHKRPYAGKPVDAGRSLAKLDLYVADIGAKDPPTEPIVKDVRYPSFAWAPDSKQLYVSSLPAGLELKGFEGGIIGPWPKGTLNQLVPVKTRLFDLATRKETPLDIPEGHGVCDVTRDGKTLLTGKLLQYRIGEGDSTTSYLVPLATLKPKAIAADEEGFDHARFSTDGSRVAGVRLQHTKSKEKGLFVYDIARERLTPVALPKDIAQEQLDQVVWAPNGKRLAVLWWVRNPIGPAGAGAPGAPGGPGGGRAVPGGNWAPIHYITTFDSNGENAKLVREFKARPYDYLVYGFDWADLVLPAAKTRE